MPSQAGLALVGLIVAGGCTDSPPVAATDFCKVRAQAICSATCCSRADCTTVEEAACQESLQRFVDDPRTGYNPARAAAYIADLRGMAAGCSLGREPDFFSVFDGTGALGTDCTPASTSASDLLLVRLSCRAPNGCRLSLRVNGELRGTCEPLGTLCTHAFDCPAERWCNLPTPFRAGTIGECQALRTDGWPCASDIECESGYCAAGTCRRPTQEERYCPAAPDGGLGLPDGRAPDQGPPDARSPDSRPPDTGVRG